MTCPGAEAASSPQLEEGDIRALDEKSGFVCKEYFDRHRLPGAECRDHGVSLEGSAGTEGPHHQPGAHLPKASPAGVSPDVLFAGRGPRGALPQAAARFTAPRRR